MDLPLYARPRKLPLIAKAASKGPYPDPPFLSLPPLSLPRPVPIKLLAVRSTSFGKLTSTL